MAVDSTPSMQAQRTLVQCWGTPMPSGLALASRSGSSSASRGSSGGSKALRAICSRATQGMQETDDRPETCCWWIQSPLMERLHLAAGSSGTRNWNYRAAMRSIPSRGRF